MRRRFPIVMALLAPLLASPAATRTAIAQHEVHLPMRVERWTLGSVPSTGPVTKGRVLFPIRLDEIPGRRMAEIHWYSSFGVVKERDFDPTLTDAQGAHHPRRVLAFSVPRRPLTSVPTDTLWASLTCLLDPAGLALSRTEALEFWVNDWRDARVRGSGLKLRVDVGQVSEDQMRAPDLPPNHRLDTEDQNDDNQLVPLEDTGIDGVGNAAQDGLPAPLDLVTANDLDRAGDDFFLPSEAFEEIDPRRWLGTNGSEGNRGAAPWPDSEDLNQNRFLDRHEAYLEYTVDLGDASSPYLVTDVYAEHAGTDVPFPPTLDNGWRRYRIPLEDSARVVFGAPDLNIVPHVRFWLDGIVSPDGPDDPEAPVKRPLLMIAGTVPTSEVRIDVGSGTPNPFATSTTFAYRLGDWVRVRAVVFDLQGRQVRVLEDGDRWPGEHQFTWDGRDADGRQVPAGLYFVRALIAGQGDRYWRVVRLP
jgi:hypothetical protein